MVIRTQKNQFVIPQLLSLALMFACFSSVWATQAKVIRIRNRVEKRDPKGSWARLRFGGFVQEQEAVKTFEKALAVLLFESGSKIRVNENSLLELKTINSRTKAAKGVWGEFDFKVDKADMKSKFIVETPVAVAGATGTEFKVRINKKDGETLIFLFKGGLQITARRKELGEVRLRAGQMITIGKHTQQLKPEKIPKEFLKEVREGPWLLEEGNLDWGTSPSPSGVPAPESHLGSLEERRSVTEDQASNSFIKEEAEEQNESTNIDEESDKKRIIIGVEKSN